MFELTLTLTLTFILTLSLTLTLTLTLTVGERLGLGLGLVQILSLHNPHSQKSCTVSGSESWALKREFSNWDLSFLECLYIFPAVLSVITRNTADQSFWESKMAAKKCFVDFAFSAAPNSTDSSKYYRRCWVKCHLCAEQCQKIKDLKLAHACGHVVHDSVKIHNPSVKP